MFDQVFFVLITIASYFTPPLVLTWVWVTLPKGFVQPRWRAWTGFTSLVAVTLDTVAFVGAVMALGHIEGFNERVHFWISWMKINRIACLAAMLTSVIGKGRFRWASFSAALSLISAAAVIYEMK
jgi:hypothetical protein